MARGDEVQGAVTIVGAQVILPDAVAEVSVSFEDGWITDIGGPVRGAEIDGRELYLAPAMVDIHGDAFERQLMPRPKVFFPLEAAILDTDRQIASNGIGTAYHALTLSWEPGLRAIERGEAFFDALEALAPRLTIDNRVQLRWETFAFEARALITRALASPRTPSVAFNDHTSMTMRDYDIPVQERLFEHSPDFRVADPSDPRFKRKTDNNVRSGLSQEDYAALLLDVWERREEVPGMIAEVAAEGRAAGAPMLSHDDTQDETRQFYRGLGARVAEFPMKVPVARNARSAGDLIVFGAPNVVRGGSHIGASPSAADMVEDGLCDALASDYFYPAMLAAVARMHEERRGPLHRLWHVVSAGPAAASDLSDRGKIAVGQRADLVLIDWPETGFPAVKRTLSAGQTAYRAV